MRRPVLGHSPLYWDAVLDRVAAVSAACGLVWAGDSKSKRKSPSLDILRLDDRLMPSFALSLDGSAPPSGVTEYSRDRFNAAGEGMLSRVDADSGTVWMQSTMIASGPVAAGYEPATVTAGELPTPRISIPSQDWLDFYRKTLSPSELERFDLSLANGTSPARILPFRPNAGDPSGGIASTLPAMSGAPSAPAQPFKGFNTGGLLGQAPLGVEYWSGAADARPIIELALTSEPGDPVPTSVDLTLTINGSAQATKSFTVGGYSAGQDYVIADRVSTALTSSGRMTWSAQAVLHFSGSGDQTVNASGEQAIVALPSTSATGQGWNLIDLPKLVIDGGGQWVAYSAGAEVARLYKTDGSGGWYKPINDYGSLTYNGGTSLWTYTGYTGEKEIFNSSGLVVRKLTPQGLTTTFSYDGSNRLIKAEAANGDIASYTYASNKLATIEMPGGGVQSFTYDGSGRLTGIQLPDGASRNLRYDTPGRLIGDDWSGSTTTYTYDATNRLLTETTQTGGRSVLIEAAKSRGIGTAVGRIEDRGIANVTLPAGGEYTMTYSRTGGLVKREQPGGGTDTWTRDSAGRVSKFVDARNMLLTYTYDSGTDNLTLIERSDGSTVSFAYDATWRRALGFTWKRANPDDEFILDPPHGGGGSPSMGGGLAFDNTIDAGTGLETTFANPGGGVITLTWNQFKLETVKDPLGGTTTYSYDASWRLNQLEYPGGGKVTATYDSAGRPEVIRDMLDRPVTYSYDGRGRATAFSAPGNRTTSWEYDDAGRATEATTASGLVYRETFDPATGQLVSTKESVANNLVFITTTMQQDTNGMVTAFTAPGGRTTNWLYDGRNNPIVVTDPMGNATTNTYDAGNRLIGILDSLGRQTAMTRDALGRIIKLEQPGGGVVSYSYDGSGNVVLIRDQLDRPMTNTYDVANRLLTTQNSVGLVSYSYDNNGNLATINDALNHTTTFEHDLLDRRTGKIDALGRRVTWNYDAIGRLLSAVEPGNRTTNYTYTTEGFLEGVQDPTGNWVTMGYDANGNVESVRNALGQRTTNIYDLLNRRIATIDPLGRRGTVTWASTGEVASITDAGGKIASYTYDDNGRVIEIQNALGDRSTNVYDAVSNLIARIDGRNNRTTYIYDALDRLQVTVDALGNRVTNVYDVASNLVATVDALNRTTTHVYDGINRLIATVDALGNRNTNVYDAAGNVISQIDALNHVVTYGYDALNRLVMRQDAAGTTASVYDASGNVEVVIDALNRRVTYGYDAAGRQVTKLDALNRLSTTVYDALGQVVAQIDPLGNRSTNVYDAAGQMTVQIDALGNRTTSTFDADGNVETVRDALDRVTTYGYDDINRRIFMVDALGNRVTSVYDANDNLVASVDPLNRRTTYIYDELNRWVATVDALGNRGTAVYDAVGNLVVNIDALNRRVTSVYDDVNRILATVDSGGNRSTNVYDAVGNVVATIDALNRVTTYGYDEINRLTSIEDALGNRSTNVYDAVSNLTNRIDALNRPVTYSYDAANRQISTEDALGNRTTTVYDDADNVRALVDALGRRTTFTVDALGRTTEIEDALGNRTTSVFDAVGNRIVQIDALNRRTTVHYDALNRVLDIVDALGNRVTSVYDAAGNQIASIDPLNRRATFVYDELNRMVASVDGLGNRATSVFDAAGQLLAQIDQLGNRTSFSYDSTGRLETIENALNQRTTNTYDAVGNRISSLNAASELTTWQYDALNRVLATIDPLGNRTTSGYDAVGNLVSITNPLNKTSSFVYDAIDRRIASIDPLDNRTTTGYDAVGNAVTITDPRNNTTTVTYDALNRVETVSDAMLRLTTNVYDAVGNRIVQIDGIGERTTSTFDALNRVIAVTKPDGGINTSTYDAAGQLQTVTDPLNHTVTFGYDAAGRQITQTDALSFTTTTVFDAAGNRTELIDAVNNHTTWAYDALNRMSRMIDPQNGTTTYSYDSASRLNEVIDPTGRKKAFGFDAAGRKTTESWYASGGALSQIQTFTYDNAGRMTGAADADGVYAIAYDDAGRATRVDEPFGLTMTFSYDAAGNRTVVEDSKGGLLTNTYNAVGELSRRQFTGNGGTLREDLNYTARGELESLWRYSDLAGSTVVGRTLNEYDPTGRLSNRKQTDGPGFTIWEGTYTYDLADRITAKIENGVTTSYSYDATDQLIKDGSAPTLTYDGTGNRTNSGYVTDTGNRMTNDGTWTYTYDTAGNVIKKSKGASLETWNYTYDHNNQLTLAEKHATDGGALQGKVEYAYDAFGNRLSRKEYNGTPTLTSEARFGYDGWDTAKPGAIGRENFDVWADLNSSNALQYRRVFNTGFDDLAARVSAGGTVNWYLTDNQGSVRNLTNSSGAIVGTMAYDAFGKITTNTGTTDRYGYTGGDHDAFTAIIDRRARSNYDPTTGRFNSVDPMGFEAGDANIYRYVGNFVTGESDPSGQSALSDIWDGVTNISSPRDVYDLWWAGYKGLNWDGPKNLGKGVHALGDELMHIGQDLGNSFISFWSMVGDPVFGWGVYTFTLHSQLFGGYENAAMQGDAAVDYIEDRMIDVLSLGTMPLINSFIHFWDTGDPEPFGMAAGGNGAMVIVPWGIAKGLPVPVRGPIAGEGGPIRIVPENPLPKAEPIKPSTPDPSAGNTGRPITPGTGSEPIIRPGPNSPVPGPPGVRPVQQPIRPATQQPMGGDGIILRDGAGATPAEMEASSGGPTGGSRAGQDTVRTELIQDWQAQNPGQPFRCWRCGATSMDPADFHVGHRNVPTSMGGNLDPVNVVLEGAACNLSAGNRGAPSPGMSCAERGSPGAPYGR
jgi:RHS repeat-associated protein